MVDQMIQGQNQAQENSTSSRRIMKGIVVSDAMDKTIVVKVERQVAHPKYKKLIRKTKKIHAHDENNTYHIGDSVSVVECRPISKTKTWMVL